MKRIALFFVAALSLAITLSSCGGTSKAETELAAKATDLNMEFLQLAKGSPDFIESMSCEYSAPNLLINTKLNTDLKPEMFSQALVEYVVANYIRSNAGALMDGIVNGINLTKGSISITITNVNEEAKEYTIGHARLVQLVQKKNSELNFNDVKQNVVKIMETECAKYADDVKAESCTFALANGFAQYTITFKNASAFSNQTQGSVLGRYIKVLKEQYQTYGAASYLVIDILKSLQLDGYRFVYTDPEGTAKISSPVAWKNI